MQIRLSKKLSEIIGRVAVREGDARDLVALEILRDGENHASYILHKLLDQIQLWRITHNLEGRLDQAPRIETDIAAYIEKYCGPRLKPAADGTATAHTGHFLLALLTEGLSQAAGQLLIHKPSVDIIRGYVADLPAEEDYYAELNHIVRTEAAWNDDQSYGAADDAETRAWPVARRQTSSLLESMCADLTEAAARGNIDNVVGRQGEIARLVQILCRRKKNNPVLIGEAGVGKSAIVEGLALNIARGEAPHLLRCKRILSLDVASLVAGTKYRGQFEEKIKAMIDELVSRGDVILFIDEIHTIMGAGSTQGSLDVANILKPALARGQIQCIGATTLDEYRESIEKDAALERRFQKVTVEPSTASQTIEILQNIKSYYECHHGVRYTPESIAACVDLTGRYITDRHFPDKAIDAMDEAGARARLENTREPESITEIENSCHQAAAERLQAVARQDFPAAAEARIREAALRSRLAESRQEWERELEENPVEITPTHIEQVITSITGIPVEKVTTDERERLRDIAAHLSEKVVGQDDAVTKVAKSIQRSRSGLKDPSKPIGVFMFVGPTGVGKTFLAKELSSWMFGRTDALIRIDMSEYAEKHNVSRLIGSPPGYVGYDEGGQLTEAVRRHPYSVVLFDEIEKAHPDVFNVMLQIFDDGQLTDGLGRRVDFRNTIIIMTSNVGSRNIAVKSRAVGFTTSHDPAREFTRHQGQYRQALEAVFAPEFINRIDDIVIFNTLSDADISRIAQTETAALVTRLEALGYRVDWGPGVMERLVETGYEPRYGVRSLKRAVLETLEEPLAQMIVGGQATPGDTIEISCGPEEQITIRAHVIAPAKQA